MNYQKIDEKDRDLLADDVAGILVESGMAGNKIRQTRGMIKHSLKCLEEAGVELFVGTPGKLATDGGEPLIDLTGDEQRYYSDKLIIANRLMAMAGLDSGTEGYSPELAAAVFEKITTPLHYKRQEAAKLEARKDYQERAKKADEALKNAGKDRV